MTGFHPVIFFLHINPPQRTSTRQPALGNIDKGGGVRYPIMNLIRSLSSGQENVKQIPQASVEWHSLSDEDRASAVIDITHPESSVGLMFTVDEAILLNFDGKFDKPRPSPLDFTQLLGVSTETIVNEDGSRMINFRTKFNPNTNTGLPDNFLLGSINAMDLPGTIDYLLTEMAEINEAIEG